MKWVCLFLMFCTAAGAAEKSDAEAIAAAQKVAKAFLAAVDAGNARSAANRAYDVQRKDATSGRVEKTTMVTEGTVHAMSDERRRLGKLLSRTLEKTEVHKELDQPLPRGTYVRFTYNLSFEKKERHREGLVIKVDAPQAGRVVAFY